MTKTTFATLADHAQASSTWYVVDASKYVLGRMSTRIAEVLMGKHKPLYTPHISVGDGVIVINAGQVQVTGNKREGTAHRYYTGYIDGLKEIKLGDHLEKNPEEVITLAVRRMLPKTRLGRDMLRRLKVYRTAEHPHTAQQPTELKI